MINPPTAGAVSLFLHRAADFSLRGLTRNNIVREVCSRYTALGFVLVYCLDEHCSTGLSTYPQPARGAASLASRSGFVVQRFRNIFGVLFRGRFRRVGLSGSVPVEWGFGVYTPFNPGIAVLAPVERSGGLFFVCGEHSKTAH